MLPGDPIVRRERAHAERLRRVRVLEHLGSVRPLCAKAPDGDCDWAEVDRLVMARVAAAQVERDGLPWLLTVEERALLESIPRVPTLSTPDADGIVELYDVPAPQAPTNPRVVIGALLFLFLLALYAWLQKEHDQEQLEDGVGPGAEVG